jgi:hypothetical protein
MKKKKLILFGGIGLIIVLFIFFSLTLFFDSKIGEKISPIQIIKFSDENSSIIITKNNLDKSATIDMAVYIDSKEMQNEFMDLTEFTTNMICGLMGLAFFDPEGLEELNNQIKNWNEMDGVIENDKGQEQGTPKENILEGYEVKKVEFILSDKSTKNKLSECIITGKEEKDIEINYF